MDKMQNASMQCFQYSRFKVEPQSYLNFPSILRCDFIGKNSRYNCQSTQNGLKRREI